MRAFPRLIVLVWTFVALPFTFLGFGSDPDAWLVASTAYRMQSTGAYACSRSTCFPLHEILSTPLVLASDLMPFHNPLALADQWYLSNLLSLAAGMACLLALFRLSRGSEFHQPLWVVVTFGFLPVVLKNSASTMDYLPALALLIWAYVFMREEKWLAAALLIGLACGSRPSSGLFLLPVSVYAWQTEHRPALVIKMWVIGGLSALLAYSPVLITRGIPNPAPGVAWGLKTTLLAGGYYALRLFGILQSLVLVGVLGYLLFRALKAGGFRDTWLVFHLVNLAVWIVLFIWMPAEPEYLLPLVPSVIFLLDRLAGRKTLIVLTVLLLSYHLVQFDLLGGESGKRLFEPAVQPGFTIQDVQDRLWKLSTRRAASQYQAVEPTLLMYGMEWILPGNPAWEYDTDHKLYRQVDGQLYLSGRIMNEAFLRQLKSDGFRIYAWQGEKSEYIRSGNTYWQIYAEVIDDLSAFFSVPLVGKALNQR